MSERTIIDDEVDKMIAYVDGLRVGVMIPMVVMAMAHWFSQFGHKEFSWVW